MSHLHAFPATRPRACALCGQRSQVDTDLWTIKDALVALRFGQVAAATGLLASHIADAQSRDRAAIARAATV